VPSGSRVGASNPGFAPPSSRFPFVLSLSKDASAQLLALRRRRT
jgi:hypothetical protein